MANVLHRTSKIYIESANTPEYPIDEWIINPDLSAVEGIDPRYWKIVGNEVSVMSPAEQAATDWQEPFIGLDLAASIALATALVNKQRDMVLEGGWTYDGVRYDSDTQARQNMSGTMTLISTGYILPSTFTWRAADNTDQTFNNETFTGFFRTSCVWVETVYQTSWEHKRQIAALTSAIAVRAYDYTTGWPT